MMMAVTLRVASKSLLERTRFLVLNISPTTIDRRGNVGEMAPESHPRHQAGPYKDVGDGDARPRHHHPWRGGVGVPLHPHAGPARPIGDEIGELKDALRHLRGEEQNLTATLLVPNARQRWLRQENQRTHIVSDDGVVVRLDLSADSRVRRRNMFSENDALAREYGPVREERRHLRQHIAALEKQLNHLLRIEEKAKHGSRKA